MRVETAQHENKFHLS